MQEELRRAGKGQMIALMQAGHPWQEAATMAGVRIGRSAAYQLLRNVRTHGEIALHDGRHGHPVKLRTPMLQWLESTYGKTPHTPSRMVQAALDEQFGILVSIGHLNRIRAKWGGGSRTVHREKKRRVLVQQEKPTGKKGLAVSSSWPPPRKQGYFPCSRPPLLHALKRQTHVWLICLPLLVACWC